MSGLWNFSLVGVNLEEKHKESLNVLITNKTQDKPENLVVNIILNHIVIQPIFFLYSVILTEYVAIDPRVSVSFLQPKQMDRF